jgi:L-ascorbate metabolism protein UlaG (beta-lactamase superfamily)
MWKYFWERNPRHPEEGYDFPVLKPDLAALRNKTLNPSLTWIGHATLLVQMGGLNILTDPILTERASPVDFAGPQRAVPPAITLEELPHIDVVTVSHNHYDHMDEETLLRLNAQPGGPPRFFVPLGLKPWYEKRGITTVVELDWWDRTEYRGLTVYFVPSQHFSARSLFDRNESLWGGWVLKNTQLTFYHAGDTGYSRNFTEIGRRLGPITLAALPIGSYDPQWMMKSIHLNPEEAVQAHIDLGATASVAIHWGTFPMTDEPLTEPPQRLAAALTAAEIPPERFFMLTHGETRSLENLAGNRLALQ